MISLNNIDINDIDVKIAEGTITINNGIANIYSNNKWNMLTPSFTSYPDILIFKFDDIELYKNHNNNIRLNIKDKKITSKSEILEYIKTLEPEIKILIERSIFTVL